MKRPSRTKRARALSPDISLVLTIHDTSALLKISEASVYRLLRRGHLRRLPGIRRILIPRSSVDALLASVREAS